MEIKLIGSLDYKKVKELISSKEIDEEKTEEILNKLKKIEKARHSEIVSTAGRLSRFPGTIDEVLNLSESKTNDQNTKFIKNVIQMGHNSITDHDYLVFSIKDVSATIEQMIIAERYSSFTIKSRREVDFSTAGFYVPDFHDKNGDLLENNDELKEIYVNHMKYLFNEYKKMVDNGIKTEDARFILPYCFHSNIIMGIDAHTLFDMIIKFTKTKYSKVDEFREFGNKLYEIAKEYTAYLIPIIDKIPVTEQDNVDNFLNNYVEKEKYQILNSVKLLNYTSNPDDQILISSIMRRYQFDYEKAKNIYNKLCQSNPNFKYNLMKKIAFEGDKQELSQVNFNFQIPVSYAILTHFTRHRTHKIIVPDFFPNIDLTQYKTPPILKKDSSEYNKIFETNKKVYDFFKSNNVRDEDLIYFTLSGNMTNMITNMDAWTLRHILELRECNKAQWETREIANQMHKEIKKTGVADVLSSILGPTCETLGVCREKREHCGKKLNLKKEEITVL